MSAHALKDYVIAQYDMLEMSAEEISQTIAVPVEDVQKIIDDHRNEVDAWLMRAQWMYDQGEVGCEYDR